MKKTALLLLSLALFLPLWAQQVRNKPFDVTLREYSIDEIVRMFGKPVQIDSGLIDWGLVVEYPHAKFYYYGTTEDEAIEWPPQRYVPDGFETDSPDFCILSKYFPGGIRVGDRIERIRKLDIVHSKPGKGREKNGLRKADWGHDKDYYQILGEEYDHFILEVEDSVVQAIHWSTPIDWGRFEGGLLWKIYGEGPAPSYVLGTFPNAPTGFYSRIKGLDQALKNVKAVYREDPVSGPWSRNVTEKMYLPGGTTLESLYKWEEWVDIRNYVKQVTGFRPETLEWCPDGLTRYLLSFLLDQALPELSGTEEDLADYLCRKAQEEGKEVHTLAFPFRNDRKNDSYLLRMVRDPEGAPDHVKEKIRHLYAAWQAQDLDEFSYSLMEEEEYSPLTTNMLCHQSYASNGQLLKAIEEGPILILIDCAALNSFLLHLSRPSIHVQSIRP